MRPKQIITSAHQSLHFKHGETRRHGHRTVFDSSPMIETGEASPEVAALPYYHLVPKDHLEQLRWRKYVRERCHSDIPFRHAILQACEEDILFFCNSFLWVFEPRLAGLGHAIVPLNTWVDQDSALVWLDEAFGVRDCAAEKARDLGLSWDCIIVCFRRWLMQPLTKIGFASLTVEKADSKEDSDALMWKLNFLHEWMPGWWVEPNGVPILYRTLAHHTFHNLENGSTVSGYACTENFQRGGRKTQIFMDEFAEWPINAQQMALDSTQYAGKRFIVSTFTSDSDRFFQIMRRERSTMLKIVCDWKDNPEKQKGLYTAIGGHLKILDPSYIFPPDYPYILDGKVRSPYYDDACTRPGSTPQSIARELDRDPQGTTSKIFSAGVLQKAAETCKTPYFIGNLDFSPGDWVPIWRCDDQGKLRIWKDMHPETGELGFGGPYALGCDVSHGSGSSLTSNSALEVFDMASGEQVMEFYSHTIRPVDFAQLVFVACKWLCRNNDLSWAYLNFENQGEGGGAFRNEILRLGWTNIYRTRGETKIYREKTDKIGYYNKDGGYSALCELQRGIQQDECILRSEKTVFECGQYELGSAGIRSGKCIHVGSRFSGDPASMGTAHGDCAIAASLAWMALKDRPVHPDQVIINEDPDLKAMRQIEIHFGMNKPKALGDRYIDFRNAG